MGDLTALMPEELPYAEHENDRLASPERFNLTKPFLAWETSQLRDSLGNQGLEIRTEFDPTAVKVSLPRKE